MEDFPFFLLLLSPSLPSICESADRSYFRVLVFTGHFAFTGHYGPFAKRVWFTARGGGRPFIHRFISIRAVLTHVGVCFLSSLCLCLSVRCCLVALYVKSFHAVFMLL